MDLGEMISLYTETWHIKRLHPRTQKNLSIWWPNLSFQSLCISSTPSSSPVLPLLLYFSSFPSLYSSFLLHLSSSPLPPLLLVPLTPPLPPIRCDLKLKVQKERCSFGQGVEDCPVPSWVLSCMWGREDILNRSICITEQNHSKRVPRKTACRMKKYSFLPSSMHSHDASMKIWCVSGIFVF